jgi:hypothetical protein
MKNIKYYLGFSILLMALVGCQKDFFQDISFVNSGTAPDKLSALFTIAQDNTGNVKITPNGEGATNFDVSFGDNTPTSATVEAGQSVSHKYAEGVYTVKLTGYSSNAKVTEADQELTVSFKAPENLEANIEIDNGNSFQVNVSATADYETFFQVYFGEDPNETPVNFNEGQTVNHVYQNVGTYSVRVVALSGGQATSSITKEVTISNPILLPLDFEGPANTYSFTNFDGGVITIINNPQKTGLNTSNQVAKMVKNAGQTWGGSLIQLDQAIDFSSNKIFRMKVFSPRVGAKVLLKVENATNSGINFEKEVLTTKANEWEDLAFDYSLINTANSYHKIVLIFDNGTAGDGSANYTWLIDDIRQTNVLPSNQLSLPVTFDNSNVIYNPVDFGNASTVLVNDPVNASNKVLKTTKPSGAETWAGTTLGAGVGFSSPFAFASGNATMTVRVYSPAAGITVKLKAEDHSDNTKSVETDAVTTKANAWETLTFDFTNHSSGTSALNTNYTYDIVSIFFDFGTAGSGKVFYWDDVNLVNNSINQSLTIPLDFESSSLTFNITDFDGGNLTVVNNPQKSGINTTSKIAKMVKNSGQPWGGSYITLASPIDFSTKTQFHMNVYSPKVGGKVLLKVENLTDGNKKFEKEVSTTTANQWEDLTFDFSEINKSNSYQKVVIICDLGTVGDGSANFTYLLDNITLK